MWECGVCNELIDADDINAEWLLQYDFAVCCRCVIEYDMTIGGKNNPLALAVGDVPIKEIKPSKARAMADVNGEI